MNELYTASRITEEEYNETQCNGKLPPHSKLNPENKQAWYQMMFLYIMYMLQMGVFPIRKIAMLVKSIIFNLIFGGIYFISKTTNIVIKISEAPILMLKAAIGIATIHGLYIMVYKPYFHPQILSGLAEPFPYGPHILNATDDFNFSGNYQGRGAEAIYDGFGMAASAAYERLPENPITRIPRETVEGMFEAMGLNSSRPVTLKDGNVVINMDDGNLMNPASLLLKTFKSQFRQAITEEMREYLPGKPDIQQLGNVGRDLAKWMTQKIKGSEQAAIEGQQGGSSSQQLDECDRFSLESPENIMILQLWCGLLWDLSTDNKQINIDKFQQITNDWLFNHKDSELIVSELNQLSSIQSGGSKYKKLKNTRKRNTRKRNTRKRNTRKRNTRKRKTRKRNTRKRKTRKRNTRKRK